MTIDLSKLKAGDIVTVMLQRNDACSLKNGSVFVVLPEQITSINPTTTDQKSFTFEPGTAIQFVQEFPEHPAVSYTKNHITSLQIIPPAPPKQTTLSRLEGLIGSMVETKDPFTYTGFMSVLQELICILIKDEKEKQS